jgi:ubiquinone/menaquinone biosynthesis C-methylase UbiE
MSTAKQAIQEQFGGSAAAYVSSAVHANAADLERMVALAAPRGHEHVLDVATGGGHTALAFAPHVASVVATDLTPAMLAVAEQFVTRQGITNVRWQIADAEALPFEAEQFDIVTCRVAPHHFDDVQQFVREVARVLRSGGLFVLDDTIAPEDRDLDVFINAIEKLRDPTHVRDYTVSEWRALCENAGLQVEGVETWTKAMQFDDWCSRARVSETTKDHLARQLLGASAEARTAFAIEGKDERVRQFVLHSALMLARKQA